MPETNRPEPRGRFRHLVPPSRRAPSTEQRHKRAKRIILGPVAPLAQRWALSGDPSSRKATVLRRMAIPPLRAAAKDFERRVPDGFRYAGNTADFLGLMVYLFGVWEPNLSAFLRARLGPGDTFIDVGANSGWFTAFGAHLVGPTGRVVGVEASAEIARRLQDNLDRNDFRHARVVIAAATAEPCMVEVVPGPVGNTGLTRIERAGTATAAAVQVPGYTLPSMLTDEEIATARVVKIDVEGAEYGVIAGLATDLDRFPDTCEFVVEIGPDRAGADGDLDRLLEVFTRRGYVAYELPNFYTARSYLLERVATVLNRAPSRPTTQMDVVFSKLGGDTLTV